MSQKQGPVFIQERCGCRVDHGIPHRCPQHQLGQADAALVAPREQTAWLVALGSSPPQWWTGRGHEFTAEVDGTQRNPACSAMRFARREDAERAIGWLVKEGTRDGCRAEEHIWLKREQIAT